MAKTGYSVHVMQVDHLTDKEKWEQRVFAAFAKRSGLKINECSIKSCKPPMPDICCSLDGSDYFFELAEVVPQVQAQALNTKGVYTSAFPDPDELGPRAMVNILRQKRGKKYETGGSPVDLLLYFSKDFPMYFPDVNSDGADPTEITEIDLAVEECKQSGHFYGFGVTVAGLTRLSSWRRSLILSARLPNDAPSGHDSRIPHAGPTCGALSGAMSGSPDPFSKQVQSKPPTP